MLFSQPRLPDGHDKGVESRYRNAVTEDFGKNTFDTRSGVRFTRNRKMHKTIC